MQYADCALAETPLYRVRNGPNPIVRQNEIYLPLYNKQSEQPLESTLRNSSTPTLVLPSISETLADLVNPYSKANQNNRVVQYSPRYRLSFTLLNEDASAGSSASNWNIQAGLTREFAHLKRDTWPQNTRRKDPAHSR